MTVKKICFSGSILSCGISNINAGCCKNLGKNLTIDLDNFKYSTDIIDCKSSAAEEYHLLGLNNSSIEKINNLKKDIKRLEEKKGGPTVSDYEEIKKKNEEIDKVKLNKFYFELVRVDGKKMYNIIYKKTNVNIEGYQKAKEEYKDILNLYQKQVDEKYEGGTELSDGDRRKLYEFENSNGEFFILKKNIYLEKKRKILNKSTVELYEEILEIYKKV